MASALQTQLNSRQALYLCRGRQEGYCDLPHLSVANVKAALIRETHQNLDARLKKLSAEEDRLRKLNLQRERITAERRQSVNHTADALSALEGHVNLLAPARQLYLKAPNKIRRMRLETFYPTPRR